MSDAVAAVGAYAFFFGVYVPMMVGYMSGAFDGMGDKFAAYFMTANEFADDA